MSPAEGERVRIGQATGRPMLLRVGKRPLREVRAFPAQRVSRFAPDAPEGALAESVDWSGWRDRWRAIVDSVVVDAAFDGEGFDVDLIDIPERRSDLVSGRCEVPADGSLPAAARITDRLGEEVLVVETLR